MSYTPVTIAQFKAHFVRDFPYGTTSDKVMDADITKAMGEASFNFNEGLFDSQETFNIGFLYLTAHFLVIDLRNSSQGIAGTYPWLESSKSVGSVSQSFSIPQKILDHPSLAMLTRTSYGGKYLELMLPLIVGQVFTVCGGSKA